MEHPWTLWSTLEKKNFGETSTPVGHKLFFSGREDRHKNPVNVITGCRPVSCRLITIRLRASPFNIRIIQAYAPTTDYDDDDIEDFYDQLQEVIYNSPKKDILVVQGDWNAKIGEGARKNWKETCGEYCNPETNERGLRLLEFVSYNNLKVANTFGPHKLSRRWTCHSQEGDYHNQIDYIMVQQRFQRSVNIEKTRSFPGADTGSDHEFVMMTFRLHLQRMKNQGNIRIRFCPEKNSSTQTQQHFFSSNDRRKFAPLLALENQDTEIDVLINSFNTDVTETANNILGKHRPAKKPWVTDNILKLCDRENWNKRRIRLKVQSFIEKPTSKL